MVMRGTVSAVAVGVGRVSIVGIGVVVVVVGVVIVVGGVVIVRIGVVEIVDDSMAMSGRDRDDQ